MTKSKKKEKRGIYTRLVIGMWCEAGCLGRMATNKVWITPRGFIALAATMCLLIVLFCYIAEMGRVDLFTPMGSNGHSNSYNANVSLPSEEHSRRADSPSLLLLTSGSGINATTAGGGCWINVSRLPYCAETDIRVDQLYDEISFNNLSTTNGWKLGFEPTYDRHRVLEEEPTLEVIVLPQAHNDPGYKDTFGNYYRTKTNSILNNAISYLGRHPDVSFEWAEICFLELWWQNHGVEEREALKRVVASGQLEILSGGWVMPDEANTHYYALVMQLLEGHEWLRNHLPGIIPVSHYQSDAFGLSPTIAYLMHEAGIRQGVALRIHYAVKDYLAQRQQLEFRWRQAWAGASNATDFLMHIMPMVGFHVSDTCGVDPTTCCQFDFAVGDGKPCLGGWTANIVTINANNVFQRANILADQFRKKAQLYKENVIFVPWGEDNRYADDGEWDVQVDNLRQLFDYINNRPRKYNMHVRFGTIRTYFDVLRERLLARYEKNIKAGGGPQQSAKEIAPELLLPTLSGDFYPLSVFIHQYWSGYYTSRPFHKYLDRTLQHYLRAADILYTAAINPPLLQNFAVGGVNDLSSSGGDRKGKMQETLLKIYPQLVAARRQLGVFQHHDGVAGTARKHVMDDYVTRLSSAIKMALSVIEHATTAILSREMPPWHNTYNKEPDNFVGKLRRQLNDYTIRLANRLPSVVMTIINTLGTLLIRIIFPFSTYVGDLETDDSVNEKNNDEDGQSPLTLSVDQALAGIEQRVLQPKNQLVLFNSLGFTREEVVCVFIPLESNAKRALLMHESISESRDDGEFQPNEEEEKDLNSREMTNSRRHNWRPLRHQQIHPHITMQKGVHSKVQEEVLTIAYDREKLCFLARISALGFRTFLLDYEAKESGNSSLNRMRREVRIYSRGLIKHSSMANRFGRDEKLKSQPYLTFANGRVAVEINATTGLLKQLALINPMPNGSASADQSTTTMRTLNVEVSFVVYKTDLRSVVKSGVYAFMPEGPAQPVSNMEKNSFILIDGPLHKSVVVKLGGPYSLLHTIELDVLSDAPTIRNLIDISGHDDTEMAMRLKSDPRMDEFYTELNAYQLIRRHRHLDKLPINAHFFPMPGAAFIQGKLSRLSLLGRQALGTASLKPGWMEVMLDRRVGDEGYGLEEGAQDNRPTESHFRLLLEEFPRKDGVGVCSAEQQRISANATTAYPSLHAHRHSLELHYPVVVQFRQQNSSPFFVEGEVSLLGGPLPPDVHLVALRTLSNVTLYDEKASAIDNETLVDFTSLTTKPKHTAALILRRVGLECCLLNGGAAAVLEQQQCGSDEAGANTLGGIAVSSLFATGAAVAQPKRVAEASLTLLNVAEQGDEGGSVNELVINPMEIKSWQLEF